MISYYLSGPMRGIEEYNFPRFIEVEKALGVVAPGPSFEIFNPARNFDGDTTKRVEEYMQVDCELVLKSDVIVLLPGWENSEGAQREVALATWTGKRFMLATLPNPNTAVKDARWQFVEIDVPTTKPSPRAEAVTGALQAITGDRNNQYGPPTQDFARTAALWTAQGFSFEGGPVRAHNVAQAQILLKLSRSVWSSQKMDHWLDMAGYAGCGYEAALEAK